MRLRDKRIFKVGSLALISAHDCSFFVDSIVPTNVCHLYD